jgi:hypothetical protein
MEKGLPARMGLAHDALNTPYFAVTEANPSLRYGRMARQTGLQSLSKIECPALFS